MARRYLFLIFIVAFNGLVFAGTEGGYVSNNPAAQLSIFKDGLYGRIANKIQFAKSELTDKQNEGEVSKSSIDDWFIPSGLLAYKKDNWGLFFSYSTFLAGIHEYPDGSMEYKDKLCDATEAKLGARVYDAQKAENGFKDAFALAFGGAYKINSWCSLGLGLIYKEGTKVTNGSFKSLHPALKDVVVNIERETDGYEIMLTSDFAPYDDLHFGFVLNSGGKYMYEFSKAVDTRPIQNPYKVGNTERKDVPPSIITGISYKIIPEFTIEAAFGYYFYKEIKVKDIDGDTNNDYDNAYDITLYGKYRIAQFLGVFAGITYNDSQYNLKTNTDSSHKTDAYILLGGFNIGLSKRLLIDLSVSHRIMLPEEGEDVSVPGKTTRIEYDGSITDVTIGLLYKFF
ncbi:MAG: hypothetical protein HQK76_07000 [Desulfobacterales bacterium]|nr:hypothetical protein [Desulfobacterales bacterium]